MRTERQRGFTLIELMVVIAIVSIIASMAAPGMQSFVAGQRVKAVAYDLTSDLLLARSEAIKRNDAANPVTLASSAGGWAAGWSTFSGTLIISSRGQSGDSVTLVDTPDEIVFDGNGRKFAPAGDVRITIESSSSDAKRCVELDLSGRARSRMGACS